MATTQEHATDSEREEGTGVEKRSHPTQTRHRHHHGGAGKSYGRVGSDAAVAAAAAGSTSTAGLVGSPVIAHVSKGRRFPGKLSWAEGAHCCKEVAKDGCCGAVGADFHAYKKNVLNISFDPRRASSAI